MKRRPLTLLLLSGAILLLAAGGGLLAWHPWSTSAPAAAAEPPMKFVPISELNRDLLRSVELTSASGTIELDEAEETWKIVKPTLLEVKPGPLNDLLFSLTNLSSERVIEEQPADLARYGLDKPAVTVRMTLTTGEKRELYLGDLTPAADSYYLMAKGDARVFTVREYHGTAFHYGIRELWGGGFTAVDGTDIAYLRLRKAGRTALELKEVPGLQGSEIEFRGSSLSVVYPYASSPKPADLFFLDSFAQAFTTLGATVAVDVSPKDPALYGLAQPQAELELRDGKNGRLHLFIGKQEGQVLFVQFEKDPTVYATDPALLGILDVQPFQFVSKYAAIVKLDAVDALAITAGGTRHVLTIRRATPGSEEGAQWLVDGHAVDVKAFKDFYTAAVSLQIDALRDRPVSGDAEVSMTFSLNAGSVRTFTVRFVPYSQEFYAVVKNGVGDILVNRQQVKYLLQQLQALADEAAKVR